MEDEREEGEDTGRKGGIKFLMKYHLAGFGSPSKKVYNSSERGSSLWCHIFDNTENSLNKVDGPLLELMEVAPWLQARKVRGR